MSGGDNDTSGEVLDVNIKLVVAPVAGIFHADALIRMGAMISLGEHIGEVVNVAQVTPVMCGFRGRLIGRLALDGERVGAGQPIAWVENEPLVR